LSGSSGDNNPNHERLCTDVALHTAIEQDDGLAGALTLCRWENEASRRAAWSAHQMVDRAIHRQPRDADDGVSVGLGYGGNPKRECLPALGTEIALG
jgi:hypothetical protein